MMRYLHLDLILNINMVTRGLPEYSDCNIQIVFKRCISRHDELFVLMSEKQIKRLALLMIHREWE
tara:strand:- start:449 stop:643 length:195 start_codon:yes stop_codon:yes gene_type:complete